ncbi:MAG TPA: hypothetical protein VFD52_03090 [Clostridia bacterium]|nr:hypothetical protein [Clostridia bacterium]
MKNRQETWNKFTRSGSIEDYLEFCSLHSEEEKHHAPKNRWPGDKGDGNRRK